MSADIAKSAPFHFRRRAGNESSSDGCQLTDAWGVAIQIIMFVLASIAMVLKRRWAANPRPLKTWFFDTSKQGIAACVNHSVNVLMSEYLGVLDSRQKVSDSDQCSWYFVAFIMDCLVGTYIVILLQGLVAKMVERRNIKSLLCGEYGNPPKWGPYLMQLGVFVVLTLIAKMAVAAVTIMPFMRLVGKAMWVVLEIISFNDERLKALMSLFMIPAVMNICIFWIIDSVLMKKSKKATSLAM